MTNIELTGRERSSDIEKSNSNTTPDTRPNIIYVMSDEHRGQAMSHAGDVNVQTPWMDRLAVEGVSFPRAYANCPVCVPGRGTIFSGRHAHSGPISAFADVYKAAAPSIATEVQKHGYHTAYFGKWHCGVVADQISPALRGGEYEYWGMDRQRTPEHHRGGFQDWAAYELVNVHFEGIVWRNDDVDPTRVDGYIADGITDMAIDYICGYTRPEPLLLVVSIDPPHFPMTVPKAFRRHDPTKLSVRPNFHDTPQHRRDMALYYDMVENLDWNIGRLFEALQSLPRFANDKTLLAYFSDHGDFLGSHGLSLKKSHPHDESVRVPVIFHWPGQLAKQGPMEGLFGLVDLMATTLGLAGLPLPVWNQGRDFSSAMMGRPFEGPEAVLLEMVGSTRVDLNWIDWRGFVTERWKYAFYETGRELLYDLENDPYEMDNIADRDPAACCRMREQLLELLRATREPFFDVLIEHGVPANMTVTNVAGDRYPTFGIKNCIHWTDR